MASHATETDIARPQWTPFDATNEISTHIADQLHSLSPLVAPHAAPRQRSARRH